jgi:putative aminopeptidase FrvX
MTSTPAVAELSIDVERMVDFLVDLLNQPSPTGYTDAAIQLVQAAFAPLPLTARITPKGFYVATVSGKADDAPRGITAHVDTLGAMVCELKANGRLRLTQLGGWIWNSVEGEGVTIFAADGSQYRGTILPVTASIHAHTREQGYAQRSAENMEVRIDALTFSADETAALGIEVGDIVAFDPRVERSPTGFLRSRHLDDKASVAAVYAALWALADAGLTPQQRTTIHVSNYEEVGHGAAAGFPTDLHELISVDMAVVAPGQTSDERKVTICAKDSAGPYHYGLRRRLERLARANGLAHCTDIYPYYGSDGEAYWRAGGDVAVALIGPGVDASHHYERTHIDALEATARLLAAYLLAP